MREEEPLLNRLGTQTANLGRYAGNKMYDAATKSTQLGRGVIDSAKNSLTQLGQDATRPFVSRQTHSDMFNQGSAQPTTTPTLGGQSPGPATLPGTDRMAQLQTQLTGLQNDYNNMPALGGNQPSEYKEGVPNPNLLDQGTVGSPESAAAWNQILAIHNGQLDSNGQPIQGRNTSAPNTREVNPVVGGGNAGLSQDRVNQIRLGVQNDEARRQRDFDARFKQDAQMNLMYGDPAANILHGRGSKRATRANEAKRKSGALALGLINRGNEIDQLGVNAANKEQGLQGRYDTDRQDTQLSRDQAQNKEVMFQEAVKTGDFSKYNQAYGGQAQQTQYKMSDGVMYPTSGNEAEAFMQNQQQIQSRLTKAYQIVNDPKQPEELRLKAKGFMDIYGKKDY